jgi:siroheme synthase-like protein
MKLYPVHLKLEGKQALVVGGGEVASVKARALLEGGAVVKIVAPQCSDEMRTLIETFHLSCALRPFASPDLNDVWIVVAATGDPELHELIFQEATARNLLLCVADDPAHSNFIVPAVLRRDELVVTVSTSGKAPALAVRIRDYLGEILGEQYGQVLKRLGGIRDRLKMQYPDFARRREAWYRLLDTEVMPQLRRGELPSLEASRQDPREAAG